MRIRFQLERVSKFYLQKKSSGKTQPVPALNQVNLNLYDQVINALVGHSGCGKSTLARLLMRLEDFDCGYIGFRGKDIRTIPRKELRKKNQMVFQNPLLSVNPYLKVNKIVAEPLAIIKTPKEQIREKISHCLEILGLSHSCLEKYPAQLSGGELQRVVMARALVLEPEFLILDESFAALDEIMAFRLLRYFKEIFTQLQIGILYISHHWKRVTFMADVISRMDHGRIVSA
jgi:ABC-type glutathione transport system ATPase component